MTPRRELTGALCALAVVLLAACGATVEGGNTTTVATVATVPNVGALPAPLDPVAESTVPETTEETVDPTTTTTTAPTPFGAAGNRFLMLGDSILASTSKRYSNTMCQALVPLGWTVRIEAEVSRPIDFGVDVMRDVGDEDWDAGLVFLGTNYGNDDNQYLKQLNRIIVAFGDVPVVLVKVSEYRDEIREVNAVIEALTDVYDNVSIVDWNAITEERPEILWEDGIHPTTEGREMLAAAVAEHVGEAPEGSKGSCLDSSYTDDSEGSIDGRPSGGSSNGSSGSGGSGSSNTTTTVNGNATTTTVRGGTTTTVKPGGTTTTLPGGPTTTSGGPVTTVTTTPTTPTVTTTPPPVTTSPPPVTTAPPATSPPTSGP